jgi:hypothetical protein
MQYHFSHPIKYKIIHEQDVFDLWQGVERLAGEAEGKTEILVRGEDFGDIEGDSKEVLEKAFAKKQSVSEINFSFRSEQYDKRFAIYLNHQESIRDSHSWYSITSSDEQWFHAKCKQIEDLIQTLPQTNGLGRLLNSWNGWLMGFVGAFLFAPVAVSILSKTRYSGSSGVPHEVQSGCYSLGHLLMAAVLLVQLFVVGKLFPVVDLDIFQKRAASKRLIMRIILWFVGIIATLGMSALWSKIFQ